MELSEKLKKARKRLGQTQCTVSKNIGISNTALSNYETGYREPDLETLKQLAKYYGVTLDELIDISQRDRAPLCDLWYVAKGKTVLFHGQEFPMSETKCRNLRKLLQEFFGVETILEEDELNIK